MNKSVNEYWDFSWIIIKLGQSHWEVTAWSSNVSDHPPIQEIKVTGPPVGNSWKKSERSSTLMGLKVWLEARWKSPTPHLLNQKLYRGPGNQCFKKACSLRRADIVQSPQLIGEEMEAQKGKISCFSRSNFIITRKLKGTKLTTWLCDIISPLWASVSLPVNWEEQYLLTVVITIKRYRK